MRTNWPANNLGSVALVWIRTVILVGVGLLASTAMCSQTRSTNCEFTVSTWGTSSTSTTASVGSACRLCAVMASTSYLPVKAESQIMRNSVAARDRARSPR
jgi:hypothetical protein